MIIEEITIPRVLLFPSEECEYACRLTMGLDLRKKWAAEGKQIRSQKYDDIMSEHPNESA